MGLQNVLRGNNTQKSGSSDFDRLESLRQNTTQLFDMTLFGGVNLQLPNAEKTPKDDIIDYLDIDKNQDVLEQMCPQAKKI